MYQTLKLKNGLPIILVPKNESRSLTMIVVYKVGSRYETEKIAGISHFIEHMMFKGTKKRAQAIDISKALDSVGAEYNAFTAKDHTGYWIKINADHFDLAADVLADMLYNSKFDEQEIAREKGVILEEFNMYKDNPLFYLEDVFESCLYQGDKLGWEIIGTEKSLKQINQLKIINYFNSFYHNNNAVLVVAGKIDQNIKKILEKYFNRITDLKQPKFFSKIKVQQTKPRILLKFKETEQVHLGIGFPAFSYFDPRLDAFQILSVILGGSMSSRLFIQVRERRGLCYYIKAQANVYEDTGNLFIRAGLDKSKIDQAIKIIWEEIMDIKEKGITEDELLKAKELLKGHLILEMEDTANLAQWYARRQILISKIITPEQKIKQLLKVNKEQVNRTAKQIIKNHLVNLVAISPFKNENKFLKLIKV